MRHSICIVLVAMFSVACGSGGGGNGGPEVSETSPPVTEIPVVNTQPQTTTPSTRSQSLPVSSPGALFNNNYLDYALFGQWAEDTFSEIADVVQFLDYVGFRHLVGAQEGFQTRHDFRLTSGDLTQTNRYLYEGPVLGLHYARGNRRLTGSIAMEYETNDVADLGDDAVWISFSDNLPVLTGAIPLTVAGQGNRIAVEGEHNGQLRGIWNGHYILNNTIMADHANNQYPSVRVSAHIQNKRLIDGSIVTGGYYVVGRVTAEETVGTEHSFMGIFAAPGVAPE